MFFSKSVHCICVKTQAQLLLIYLGSYSISHYAVLVQNSVPTLPLPYSFSSTRCAYTCLLISCLSYGLFDVIVGVSLLISWRDVSIFIKSSKHGNSFLGLFLV